MFNRKVADKSVRFIESLKHVKGRWAGQEFKLEKWQKEIVRKLFGTLNDDGLRQYRYCYIEVPRKNGKSTQCGAIGLYLFFADGEQGCEVYCAVGNRDQASIIHDISSGMVRQEPALDSRCEIRDSYKRIIRRDKASVYRAISAEDKTKFGYSPHGVIFDELHVQPNRKLFDALVTGVGARRQPVIIMITTAGIYDQTSLAWEQHEYADKVIRGVIKDPTYMAVIYGADKDDDWRDPKVWKKANPNPERAFKSFRNGYFKKFRRYVNTPIYDLEKVQYGNVIEGPAILESPQTTVVIPPDQKGLMDGFRNVVIEF